MNEQRDAGSTGVRGVRQTRRQAVEDIARRYGVRVAVDDAVRLEELAPDMTHAAAPEEALRALLDGNELVFHYGTDSHGRLQAVWAFSKARGFAVTPAAGAQGGQTTAAASPATPVPGAAVCDAAHEAQAALRVRSAGAPPSPAVAAAGEEPPPDLRELRQLIDIEAPEGPRMAALDSFVAHPEASEHDIAAVLDRLAAGGPSLLAEHARALLAARIPLAADAGIVPEPVEAAP